MDTINILVVDDEQKVLDMIANSFREHKKYNITKETSPLQAIELLKENNFYIIITDYQMPTVNGIELLEVVKEIYNNKQYVSILSTAHGTTYLFASEQKQGLFQLFLEKPFTAESLKNVVSRAVFLLERFSTGKK